MTLRTSEQSTAFEAFIESVYRLDGVDQIVATIGTLQIPLPYKVRIKILFSELEPRSYFETLATGPSESISQFGAGFETRILVGRPIPRTVRSHFFLVRFPNLSHHVEALVSICTADQWRTITRICRDAYPKLAPINLSQTELLGCAKKLKHYKEYSVRVKAFSASSRIRSASTRSRKSIREWTDEDLDKVSKDVRERGLVLNSMDLEFFPSVGGVDHVIPRATGTIRRSGELSVTGSFDVVFEAVAEEVARIGLKKLEFLSGRGLRESSYTPRPLSIEFNSRIFDDLENVRSFVTAVRKYPKSMHAVLHGNPYAHIKLVDILDRSSFELWVIPPKRIALIPGIRATGPAFDRLVAYLFDKVREGQLQDYGVTRQG
ncbi:MAG: hypothetical protein ACC655_05535 [Rhodothermia bacterium]